MLVSIRSRMMASHMLIVLLVMLIIGPVSYYMFKQHLLKEQRANLHFIARHAAGMVEDKIIQLEKQLAQVVSSRVVQDFPDTARVSALSEYFIRFEKDFPILGYLNTTGQPEVKVVSGQRASELDNYPDEDFFNQARLHPNQSLYGVSAKFDIPALSMIYGVQRYFGDEFVGAVFASTPLTAFTSFLSRIDVGETGYLCLVEHSGRVLFYPDQSHVLTELSTDSRNDPLIKNALSGLTGVADGELFGVRGLIAYATVEKLNASLLVILPYDELVAAPIKIRNTILLVLSAIFVFGCIVAMLLANRLTRPILKLTSATRQLSAGDFSGQIDSRADGEIGELVATFNQMVGELRHSTVSRQYFDRILCHMQEGLLLVGLDGKIRTANQSACRMIGEIESNLAGRLLEEFFNDGGSHTENWVDMLLSEPGEKHSRKLLKTKSSGDLPVSFVWSVLEDADGSVREVACLFLPEKES